MFYAIGVKVLYTFIVRMASYLVRDAPLHRYDNVAMPGQAARSQVGVFPFAYVRVRSLRTMISDGVKISGCAGGICTLTVLTLFIVTAPAGVRGNIARISPIYKFWSPLGGVEVFIRRR